MIRSFDASISYATIDDGLKSWLAKNQRPLVVAFDDRTIGEMFSSQKKGLVLFNGADDNVLLEAFTSAAQEYSAGDSAPLVFTEINSKSEHLANFANYIKINHQTNPVILVSAGEQIKYVMSGEVTKENIVSFLANYESFKYGLTDEVKAAEEAAAPTEEEL